MPGGTTLALWSMGIEATVAALPAQHCDSAEVVHSSTLSLPESEDQDQGEEHKSVRRGDSHRRPENELGR